MNLSVDASHESTPAIQHQLLGGRCDVSYAINRRMQDCFPGELLVGVGLGRVIVSPANYPLDTGSVSSSNFAISS